MTDDQLKLALAKMLPEVLYLHGEGVYWTDNKYRTLSFSQPVFDTEWDYLCFLAEEAAGIAVIKAMRFYLWEMTDQMTAHHATWQQRATVLIATLGLEKKV